MALGQVAARLSGDVFQGMVFWKEASRLLVDDSHVQHVSFECDIAAGVDDVAVFYREPGKYDNGLYINADFIQVKHKVDLNRPYSAGNLVTASSGASSSLLQRLHNGYRQVSAHANKECRLFLISNATWHSDDPLGKLIRQDDGKLPEQIFTAGPTSTLGAIRESWCHHLRIAAEEFDDFARRLRFCLDQMMRRHHEEYVSLLLEKAGMRPMPLGLEVNPYISVYMNLILNGRNDFDRAAFYNLCFENGLFAESTSNARSRKLIAVRSYIRFAENIEELTKESVCVAEHFDHRDIKDDSLWQSKVAPKIYEFLRRTATDRQVEYETHLECHPSLAFLSGYSVPQVSGINCFPIQKGSSTCLWKPANGLSQKAVVFDREIIEMHGGGEDIFVALSITCDVSNDVLKYFSSTVSSIKEGIHLRLQGAGPQSVCDARHAYDIATEAFNIVQEFRKTQPRGRVHLFFAAPNGLVFFLGRLCHYLMPIQLYEFSPDRPARGYRPSISLPLEPVTGR